MKGIILAGGRGTRLWPLTRGVSKQLLPVFDKPLIYYPLSTLLLMGVDDFLIITTPYEADAFKRLLGDGSQWGVKFTFAEQPSPDGLAQAFMIGEKFIDGDTCTLILGDNILFGHRMSETLNHACETHAGATVFSSYVGDPERFGVVEFDENEKPMRIEEKPENPRTNWAITGLYIFDPRVVEYAYDVRPSARGELEIIDVLQRYLDQGELAVERLGRGFTWLDCGTYDSLISAGEYVATIERNQRLKIACPEEIVFNLGYIDAGRLADLARPMMKNDYGRYLMNLAEKGAPR